MKAFLTPLQGLAEFEQIKEKSKTNKGILQVSGCMESQKSHLMYGLSGIAPYRLILAEDERRAREIYEDYRFYDRKVYSYPAKDLLFFQAVRFTKEYVWSDLFIIIDTTTLSFSLITKYILSFIF